MNQQKQNILIVETKDGAKYQGIFVSKDIEKQILTLSNVKKTYQEKEEHLTSIDIEKGSISSINIIDIRPPKEDIHNFNEIPENKKNVVDEQKLANIEKAYDKSKDDFFDHLKSMTKPEAKKESNNYNKKNKDTFNLSENDIYNYNDDNKRGWKNRGYRRGYRGGRGGYGRGNRGGCNNSYKNYQNRNNYSDEKKNYQGQNNYRGRGNRGRGRGRGNRGGYKKSQNSHYYNNGENNQNNNVNNQNENNKGNSQE